MANKKILLAVLMALTLWAPQAHCGEIKVGSLIRDAEIEDYMRTYMTALFRAANMDISKLKLYVIHDPSVNAYASVGHTMVVNTGLIMKCQNVGQLIGVLAHETGHVAGTHVAKAFGEMKNAQTIMIAGLLLGAAAGILAKRSDVAAGIALGGAQAGQGHFMSFTRAHESAADQAAAKFLDKLGWCSTGMHEVMKMFHGQELLSSANQDMYMRTHPLTQDRVSFFEHHAHKNKYKCKPFPLDYEEKFQRMKTKITAYVNNPKAVLSRISQTDYSVNARYAKSICYFRMGDNDKAFAILNELIDQNPRDPYFKELKAQMLFERGKIPESIDLYQKAITQSGNKGHMQIVYGMALIESKNPDHKEQALKALTLASRNEPDNPFIWRLLATAYGQQNKTGKADLMVAKQEILLGNFKRAKILAKRAKHDLKNKADIMMADEIINDDFSEEEAEE